MDTRWGSHAEPHTLGVSLKKNRQMSTACKIPVFFSAEWGPVFPIASFLYACTGFLFVFFEREDSSWCEVFPCSHSRQWRTGPPGKTGNFPLGPCSFVYVWPHDRQAVPLRYATLVLIGLLVCSQQNITTLQQSCTSTSAILINLPLAANSTRCGWCQTWWAWYVAMMVRHSSALHDGYS